MPLRIVTADGRTYRFVEYELPDCGPTDVRVLVEFAAPKHGTESQIIGGSAFDRKHWDPALRMFLPRDEPPSTAKPPERGIGNMIVGTVVAVGSQVTRFQVGDRVFGGGQIREIHQAPEDQLRPLTSLTPVDAVCTEPAHVGFVAVRDGNIRIGDDVAIYGLGAIGLLTVQIAKAGGARHVFGIDPIPLRREVALAHGADAVFDPLAEDVALQIKRATGGNGVDVSIETSGNDRALHEAIRCIRQCGTIVHVAWGPKSAANLHLDEEFHLNRPTLIGSQAWRGWNNPDRDHPLWDESRAYEATIDLFRTGKITGEGIVQPIVPFAQAPEALATIFTAPERSIKVGVTL